MNTEEDVILFKQRHFFERKIYTLYQDRIVVKECEGLQSRENTRYFDYFTNNKVRHYSSSKSALFCFLFCVVISLIIMVSLRFNITLMLFQLVYIIPLLLMCGFYFHTTRRKLMGYESRTQTLWFFENKPTVERFESFLAELERRREKYLYEKYGFVDKGEATTDNLSRLFWLKKEGALTEEEFAQAKEKILDDKSSGGKFYHQDRLN